MEENKRTQDKIRAGMKIHTGNCECAACDLAMFPSECPKCGQLTFMFQGEFTLCTNQKCNHIEDDDSIR